MAKTFLTKRTPAGMALMADVINDVRRDLTQAEKHIGRKNPEAVLEWQLILGSLYYVVEDYENAEPVLVKYVAGAKKEFGTNSAEVFRALWLLSDVWIGLNCIPEAMSVSAEAKSISEKINWSSSDPAAVALFRHATAHKKDKGNRGRKQAFVTALAALCLSITDGCYKLPGGNKFLDSLRPLFENSGIGDKEWEWTVKHAHLTKYDFIGLLSILLHHMGQAPVRMEQLMPQRVRVIHVQ